MICRQMMSENHKKFQSKAIGTGTKQVYYLCMEFLMGRSLKTSLQSGSGRGGQEGPVRCRHQPTASLRKSRMQVWATAVWAVWPPAIWTAWPPTGICGTGYSILYEYGIFKQKIVDGWQQELPDNWLPGGQVWLQSQPDQAVEVRFGGEAARTGTTAT